MNLNRNTGLALGFGIGIVIAAIFFGVTWLTKNSGNLLKTQALQTDNESVVPVVTVTPVAPSDTATKENSNDTLINRMAPTKDDVVNDIQKNLQQLYGTR